MFRGLLPPELALVAGRWVSLMLMGIAFWLTIKYYRQKGISKEIYQKKWPYRIYEAGVVWSGLLAIFTTLNLGFEKAHTVWALSLPVVSIWLAAILLYGFVVGDFLSTKKALSLGARELNPIARLVIAKFGINKLPILSITIMSLVLVFVWGKSAVSEQYSILVILFAILVSNTMQVRKRIKKEEK